MKRLLSILPFLLAAPIMAQISNSGVIYVSVAPSGACLLSPPIQVVASTGTAYTCNNGTWAAVAGGGITGGISPGAIGNLPSYTGPTQLGPNLVDASYYIDGANQLVFNGVKSGVYGCDFHGDSNTVPFGISQALGWVQKLYQDTGCPPTDYAVSGNTMADCSYFEAVFSQTTDSGNPVNFLSCVTNNSHSGQTSTSAQQAMDQELIAYAVERDTSADTDQFRVENTTWWTQATGTWTTQTPYFTLALFAGSLGTGICTGDVFSLDATGIQITVNAGVAPTGGPVTNFFVSQMGTAAATDNNITPTLVTSPSGCVGQAGFKFKIPSVGQVTTFNATGSGSTTATQTKQILTATGSGTLTASLPVGPSGIVEVTYMVGPLYGGTFSVLDGATTLTDATTGLTVIPTSFSAGNEVLPANAPSLGTLPAGQQGYTRKSVRFTGLTPFTVHNFTIQVLSGTVGIEMLVTPHSFVNKGVSGPSTVVVGAPPQLNNVNSTNIALWNGWYQQMVATLASPSQDGLDMKYMHSPDTINGVRDLQFGSGSYFNCVKNTDTTGLHLDSCGHAKLAALAAFHARLAPTNWKAHELYLNSSFVVATGATSCIGQLTPSVLYLQNASAQTLTVNAPCSVGQEITLRTTLAGAWTITPGSGITINGPTLLPGVSASQGTVQGTGVTLHASSLTTWNQVDTYNLSTPLGLALGTIPQTCSTANPTINALTTFVIGAASCTGITLPSNGSYSQKFLTVLNQSGLVIPVTVPGNANGIPTTIPNNCSVTYYFNASALNTWYIAWGSPNPACNGLSVPTGTATFTAGTNVTSVVCAVGFTCNNTRGTLTVVGGTATTGTIATVNFSATLTNAPQCFAYQKGGGTPTVLSFAINNSAPTTSLFNITAESTVIGETFNVGYTCQF